ncbi:MAG TPA: beta-L-arabinofuranosidase domain-containing protein [Blastocatellia bacterium]|nr:beta-L-arabinofuranosidase domain-containing protein [Blastocatellia bacterium]
MKREEREDSGLATNDRKALTRRQMLKGLGAGVVVTTAGATNKGLCASAVASANSKASASGESKPIGPHRVSTFGAADVRLLDGPFLQAQDRDATYLLQLEPDRLLHNFRVNAGLKPKAPVYGGWESVEPWIAIRCHGHTLGHYLSACSLMFAATGDATFKQRVDYIVAELRECQDAGKSGLVCAFPDGAAPLNAILNASRFVGVPWYTMHKIFAGLRDASIHTGNQTALDALVKLSDWAIGHTQSLSEQQFQRMLDTEHGGMNEVLADVYAITGETRFLTLAQRFCHRALLDPLAQSRDTLDGLHSNTQIPKVIGFNRLYELTGQANYTTAARFFWRTVVENRTFATGGNGDGEHFFPPADFIRHFGSAKTMETCCTHNMLKLTRSLFSLEPSAAYADYYERALYNSILASQDPDSGMMTYFQPIRPGYLKLYCTPTDSFWCCTGSGMENHAKYGDSIYFRGADALYANLFIPSTVTWKEKRLTVTQTTRFPEEARTQLRLTVHSPLRLTLNVRHPSWCETATIFINGRRHTTSHQPGGYIALNRVWRTGDTVEVHLPMKLRTEPLPGQADIVAILYGPIVLAGRLGREGIASGADIIVNERTTGDVLKADLNVPVLRGEPREIVGQIKPDGAALTFRTNGIGHPHDVSLIPYYRIAHERYTLYWKVVRRDDAEKKGA